MRGSSPRITTGECGVSCGMTARPNLAAPLLLHRLPCDIAAAKSIRPTDAIDRLIGALLCFCDGLAGRADIQHAATIGEDGAILGDRAGVEDFDPLDSSGVIKPLDARALLVIAGIAFRRHYDGHGGFEKPAQIKILQLPVAASQKSR